METPRIQIPESEVTFEFSRSGGPGGQNVNKVSTKVRLVFDLWRSNSLTPAQKSRLAGNTLVTRLMNEEGKIVVLAQQHRTQGQNRVEALERLNDLISRALIPKKKRIPTKKTRGSDQRRLEGKKRKGQIKTSRKWSGE